MGFNIKTWKDRVSEYPARRTLTPEGSGTAQVVTVTRSEGTVSQAGDAFNATNMNDLESRIAAEFTRLNTLTNVTIPANSWSSSAPYAATVTVSGVTTDSNPEYALDPTVTNAAVAEAFGFIDILVTATNSVTFKCLRDKPTVAIPVVLKGI